MPLYYYVVFANIENSKHAKIVITLIVILTILVGWRYWSEARWFGTAHFSYDRRISSAFGYLGANHMAAFLIQYAAIVFGIMMYQKKLVFKIILCLTFLLLVFFNFYTYSRASYLALFIVFLFFGFFKIKNFILITLILLLFGGTIYSFLPNSVIERVAGTKTETGEIESSANTRLKLWEDANKLFQNSPIFGVGYQMFPSYVDLHGLKNVHNYFMQTLCEMGIIGLFALIYIFYTAFKSGWFLFKSSINNFDKGIGVGFCGSVVVCIVCNFFGDRWSFTQVQGYWWIIWAIVDKKRYLIPNSSKAE
jgi:O-antigen ligase